MKFATRVTIVAAALLVAVTGSFQIISVVYADQYDDQINALKREINSYENEADKLSKKADTLQNALNKISAEKALLQKRIDASEVTYKKLKAEIKQTKADIATNKVALGDTLADIYIGGEVTPIEMLASSQNISDFLNEQEYQSSVRDQLVGKINEIQALEAKLEKDKKAIERVLKDQKQQRALLTKKENERAQLIRETKGKESAYQNLIAKNNDNIEAVRRQQVEANRAAAAAEGINVISQGSCGGGYPSVARSSSGYWGCRYGKDVGVDNWGMYNRECVSYVAFKIAQDGKHMPAWGRTGAANAMYWPDRATQDGIPWDYASNPQRGDAAVWKTGRHGHVMYVEAVNDAKTQVLVSDYNFYGTGQYGAPRWMPISNTYFIHF